jgi:hypothetical protein
VAGVDWRAIGVASAVGVSSAFLCPLFISTVAGGAECLMVLGIPEEVVISSMGLFVVDGVGRCDAICLEAANAEGVVAKEAKPVSAPP